MLLSSRLPSLSSIQTRISNLKPRSLLSESQLRLFRLHDRCYSIHRTPEHSIYISKSTNPYFNLTFEDWLFRHKAPDVPLLFLYRDDPCVVIGRNQNPWKEANLEALRAKKDVSFIRRRSGGGTVYHDLGNTNFSVHLPRASFDRHKTAQIILRAVRSLGIDARVNERNDICVGEEKMRSAYKIVNKRAYHHGTMLISTQLNTLGSLLHNTKETMKTRGVASVRSPVRNLQHFDSRVTHELFVDAVVREFRGEYSCHEDAVRTIDEKEYLDIEYIQKGMKELPSWEWAYGQTPEFTYTISQAFEWGTILAKIRSKHGIIVECDCSVASTIVSTETVNPPPTKEDLEKVEKLSKGRRYGLGFTDSTEDEDVQPRTLGLEEIGINGPAKDVAVWLVKAMNS